MKQLGDKLVVHVADNGNGAQLPLTEGYGLTRMRQLAHLFAWELLIDTTPGEGFKLRVRGSIPEGEVPCQM